MFLQIFLKYFLIHFFFQNNCMFFFHYESLEYNCKDKHLFGIAMTDYAKNHQNLLISAKWHRVCFSPAINIRKDDLDLILEKFIKCFKLVSKNWSDKKIKQIKYRQFF